MLLEQSVPSVPAYRKAKKIRQKCNVLQRMNAVYLAQLSSNLEPCVSMFPQC